MIWFVALMIWGFMGALAFAQTNTPPSPHYIQIPIPADLWIWISAHMFLIYWGSKVLVKILNRWSSNKVVATIIWIIENIRGESDMTGSPVVVAGGGVGIGNTNLAKKRAANGIGLPGSSMTKLVPMIIGFGLIIGLSGCITTQGNIPITQMTPNQLKDNVCFVAGMTIPGTYQLMMAYVVKDPTNIVELTTEINIVSENISGLLTNGDYSVEAFSKAIDCKDPYLNAMFKTIGQGYCNFYPLLIAQTNYTSACIGMLSCISTDLANATKQAAKENNLKLTNKGLFVVPVKLAAAPKKKWYNFIW